MDSAVPGDVVVIRDGSYYNGATIDKGIQVLGEPGVVFISLLSIPTITVQNVPAGQAFALKDIRMSYGCCNPGALEVRNCSGSVLFEDVQIDARPFNSSLGGWFRIVDSRRVLLSGCADLGTGFVIQSSNVTVADGSFLGHPYTPPQIIGGVPTQSVPGARVTDSTVVFSRCSLIAGDTDKPGLLMVNSTVALTDVAGTTNTVTAESASLATDGGGALVLDPDVQLVAGSGTIAAAILVTNEPVPSLSVTGAPIGSSISGHLASGAGEPFAVGIGVPLTPIGTPFGSQWVSLSPFAILAAGALDTTGAASWSIPIPNDLAFLGFELAYQGLAATPVGIRFSNAGQHTITAAGL